MRIIAGRFKGVRLASPRNRGVRPTADRVREALFSTLGQAVASPLQDREALIITFWRSFEEHEASHRSATFQPLFRQVLELCENGNEEIAYRMLWSGKAYSPKEAAEARAAKERYAQAA